MERTFCPNFGEGWSEDRREFEAAEQWYLKSLAISEKQGNEHGAAIAHHQLWRVAEERRAFESAEQWYLKSLAIKEKLGNEHGAAITYGQLGIIAGLQYRFEECGQWMLKCILGFHRANNPHEIKRNAENFLVSYRVAPPDEQVKLKAMWEEAGLPPLPDGDDDENGG